MATYNCYMGILIDGYNLLNATGVEGTGRGTELERARRGLLQFLADVLTADECSSTTIVFDAQGAPPGLPNQESFHGITVLFSKGYAEADDLLEELIAADHVPRNLLVVSSDHRLHRAARRRKATPVDSEVWIASLEGRNSSPGSRRPTKSDALDSEPTENWLAEFSDIDVAAIESELQEETAISETPSTAAPAPDESSPEPPKKEGLKDANLDPLLNPFPEGFGAELTKEFDGPGDLANPFPPEFFEDESEP